MLDDFLDDMPHFHRRRHRSRMVGSAGILGFMAGAFLAGKVMIWCGFFRPGVTPNGVILDYWPGFLLGGAIGGTIAALGARFVSARIAE
jgi:hypothetical protein